MELEYLVVLVVTGATCRVKTKNNSGYCQKVIMNTFTSHLSMIVQLIGHFRKFVQILKSE